MKKNNKKAPRYLDVTEYTLTGPFSPHSTPPLRPLELEQQDSSSNTPLNRPMYIEIEGGEPSPYLKQLLSKVGTTEIEFMDFTLEGHMQQDIDYDYISQQIEEAKSQEMSIIEEQEQQGSHHRHLESEQMDERQFQDALQEYVPNMHLLDLDPSLFTSQHFLQNLASLEDQTPQQQRQLILLYLTDDDLQMYKKADISTLILVAQHNLEYLGCISRLQRKAKVSRYLQKKKSRIWRKKINYDCRKKVADNRLRVKGKFVSTKQASTLLGVSVGVHQELKAILKEEGNVML